MENDQTRFASLVYEAAGLKFMQEASHALTRTVLMSCNLSLTYFHHDQ